MLRVLLIFPPREIYYFGWLIGGAKEPTESELFDVTVCKGSFYEAETPKLKLVFLDVTMILSSNLGIALALFRCIAKPGVNFIEAL